MVARERAHGRRSATCAANQSIEIRESEANYTEASTAHVFDNSRKATPCSRQTAMRRIDHMDHIRA